MVRNNEQFILFSGVGCDAVRAALEFSLDRAADLEMQGMQGMAILNFRRAMMAEQELQDRGNCINDVV